jgi:alpha-beta hydrolase superfamily lysophospholipase
VRALFFGEKNRQLLGFHHVPQGKAKPMAVLCCHPAPQEYMRTYRAVKNLADSVSRAGMHAMRFDWSGTGDSAGRLRDARLETWQQDLTVAVEELLDLSGARRLAIVGLRLGASIAALACARPQAPIPDTLLLWDPVVRGATWLQSARRAHKWHLDRHRVELSPDPGSLLGGPLPAALREDLEELDLRKLPMPAKGRRTFLLPHAVPEQLELATSWRAEVMHVADADELDDPSVETAFLTGVLGRAVGEALARELV